MGAARTPIPNLARAIRSARKAGFEPAEVVVTLAGDIRMRIHIPARNDDSADVLTEIEGWQRGRR